MKIIFFASGDFAILEFEKILQENFQIEALVTQSPKKKGRHLRLSSSSLSLLAQKSNIPVLQPQDLSDPKFIADLKNKAADLFVVVSYGKIIPKEVLEIPKIFSINIHASLLPKYRGAAPINWAIINGEKETGISIIRMNEFLDSGEIILQKSIDIKDDDDAITLNKKLSLESADMLIETIHLIEQKRFKLTPQGKEFSLAPKLKKQDGQIIWSKDAHDIYNQIRGLIPWPGSFTYLGNKLIKIWKVEVEKEKRGSAGEVLEVSKEKLIVACGSGGLSLKELQLQGGKVLKARDFLAGHKVSVGEFLR